MVWNCERKRSMKISLIVKLRNVYIRGWISPWIYNPVQVRESGFLGPKIELCKPLKVFFMCRGCEGLNIRTSWSPRFLMWRKASGRGEASGEIPRRYILKLLNKQSRYKFVLKKWMCSDLSGSHVCLIFRRKFFEELRVGYISGVWHWVCVDASISQVGFMSPVKKFDDHHCSSW